jgi:hypothetical protein
MCIHATHSQTKALFISIEYVHAMSMPGFALPAASWFSDLADRLPDPDLRAGVLEKPVKPAVN